MIFKKDNLKLGLLLGLVAPFVSLIIYYYVKFSSVPFSEFMSFLHHHRDQITAVSVPCLLLNIVLFTVYINSHRDQTAKGVFVATLIYAIVALLFKFI